MTDTGITWRIGTGARLNGRLFLHGNKNSALPCLAAGLILPAGGSFRLTNVPRISDVEAMIQILRVYGVEISWTGPSDILVTRTSYVDPAPTLPPELARAIRGSIVLLGALATQYPAFDLAKPGGDRIGGRPITAHLTALSDLGYETIDQPGVLAVRRLTREPHGGTIVLIEQSVTATLMLLLYSACLGPREHLTIVNAACEPHIVTLGQLLGGLGATIEGLASNLITIRWPRGVRSHNNPIRLDDDFMEATTYAIAAAITKSDLEIPFHDAAISLNVIHRYLQWMGVQTTLDANHWHVRGSASSLQIHPGLSVIKAEPSPRFHTDVMSMFVVLATQCTGTLKFIEYMYDDRFGFVQSLRDIGARIDSDGRHAIVVHGPTPLSGNELFLRPDIRSGAAMLLAALAASGTTVLHDHRRVIERGYQELPETLARLGAPIDKAQIF